MQGFYRLKTYGKYVILLLIVVAVYSYAMFQGGFVSWFLFYSVLTVLGLTIVVSFFTFRGFQVERTFDKNALHAGDTLNVRITIKKSVFHPFFYMRVQDYLPANLGENEEHGALFFFTLQRQVHFSYQVKNVKRGNHVFEKVELKFGDLFGLYEKRNEISCEETVLVYPKYRKLERIYVSDSIKVAEGTSSNQLNDEDRSLAGVREYVAGDRMTSIDWKQSARKAQLMTKEFESYRGSDVVVAFDPYRKSSSELHFEKTVELATSFVTSLSQVQIAVQVAIWSTDWSVFETNRQSLLNALKVFAKVDNTTETMPAVHRLYHSWNGATIYYVCTELHEGLLDVFRVLTRQHVQLHVFLVSTSSREKTIAEQCEKLGVAIHTIPS
ncbi:DUF58 domain-containing protein [Halalkalibacter urbisdiaboli]|uniref:DUF58 domain-containing protein n=1 Tax=Halalkalibacter urbisdiaboli TaxID=1960589 RepID=UPI000B42D0AC|nr:DUF58 domain-containing protein [Halalkalibacter urbisdiaboli]